MRRLALVLSLVAFLPIPLSAQAPTQAAPAQAQVTATKDPQAVSVLTQAVAAGGGTQAIAAIKDYTGSGSITVNEAVTSTIDVTIKGKGLNQLRMDESFPAGMHSLVYNRGETSFKTEQGLSPKFKHSPAPMNAGVLLFPWFQLNLALKSDQVNISYKGTTQVNEHSVYDIRLQQLLPGVPDPSGSIASYHTTEVWIDASTFQVVMTQNVGDRRLLHQVAYSDFRTINGVLVPFSVTQETMGIPASVIQLSSVSFNSGLQDSDFNQ